MRDFTDQSLDAAPKFPHSAILGAQRFYRQLVRSYYLEDERFQHLNSADHFVSTRLLRDSKNFSKWIKKFGASSRKVIEFCSSSGNVHAEKLAKRLNRRLEKIDIYLLLLILSSENNDQLKAILGSIVNPLHETPDVFPDEANLN